MILVVLPGSGMVSGSGGVMPCQASQSAGFVSIGAKTTLGANVPTTLNPQSVTFAEALVNFDQSNFPNSNNTVGFLQTPVSRSTMQPSAFSALNTMSGGQQCPSVDYASNQFPRNFI